MHIKSGLLALVTLIFLTAALTLPVAAGLPLSIGESTQELPTLAPLLERVTPGVVNIAVRGHVAVQENPLLNDPFFRRFFGLPELAPQREFQAAGSGVVVDATEGYILTNNHVIENADEVTVALQDGRKLKAELVGRDPEADIAVIRIPAKDLTALRLGDSDQLRVGDFVIAVGNPFGLGQTVTSGLISALGRTGLGIEGYEDFIQTDASINPGNSGGALVNLRGELIGINTAIVGPSGGNVGIGFAIPINMARSIMTQLIEHGEMRRGQLGVSIQDLTPEIAKALGVPAGRGAVVSEVVKGSPAAKAGVEAGDVIVAVNGDKIRNASDLRNKIGLARVGEAVTLTVLHQGRKKTVVTKLAPRHRAKVHVEEIDPRIAGATLGPISQSSPLFGRVEGVEVLQAKPGSPAWSAGLRQGDVITSVNRKPVKTLNQFATQVRKAKGALLLNIRRGDAALFIVIQ
ncbi:MAG: DegQ family serine endoprotease [Acidiferrobacterales bacterium]